MYLYFSLCLFLCAFCSVSLSDLVLLCAPSLFPLFSLSSIGSFFGLHRIYTYTLALLFPFSLSLSLWLLPLLFCFFLSLLQLFFAFCFPLSLSIFHSHSVICDLSFSPFIFPSDSFFSRFLFPFSFPFLSLSLALSMLWCFFFLWLCLFVHAIPLFCLFNCLLLWLQPPDSGHTLLFSFCVSFSNLSLSLSF